MKIVENVPSLKITRNVSKEERLEGLGGQMLKRTFDSAHVSKPLGLICSD